MATGKLAGKRACLIAILMRVSYLLKLISLPEKYGG
jgi:hypothetical protein